MILPAQRQQQRGLELLCLRLRRQLAAETLLEDRFDLRVRCRSERHRLQTVIRDPAAERGKEREALLQNADQLSIARNAAEFCKIVYIIFFLDAQRPVRAEAGQDLHAEARVFGDFFVPLQAVRRIVRSAEGLYVRFLDQLPGGQGPQFFVAELPDFFRRVAVQDAFIAEVLFELQMAPVIERVADGKRERLRPFLELLAVGRVAGDEPLVHARRAHQPPFIVVAAQPDLRDVLESAILIDLLRIEMAVVVDDGHECCEVVVKVLCRIGGQQKVLVHESLHRWTLPEPSPPASFCTSATVTML